MDGRCIRSIAGWAVALMLLTASTCDAAAPTQPTTLTGDWFGIRPTLAEKGITFTNDETQFYQGVTTGGLQQNFNYAGHGDYVTNFDFGKLGVREGLLLKIRAEHRYGRSISGDTGALLPAAIAADLPTPATESLYLTNVLFTQMFSETFGVFAGKLDTFDGDSNTYAGGRGKTQFSNLAFVVNPVALRTMPYSTLGGGFFVLHNGAPLWTVTVLNSTDTSRTSGFDELFAHGASMASELRLPTNFLGRSGHQVFGATYSTRNYVSLGQDPRVLLPNVPFAQVDGSWATYWNFDQTLVNYECDPTRGWGVFGRAGFADARANPVAWMLSFGIGGNSPIHRRHDDTFGLGWYYLGTSNQIGPILTTLFGPIGDEQGVECFYNVAVTQYLHVTADLQVLDPSRQAVPTSLLVGLRAKLDF